MRPEPRDLEALIRLQALAHEMFSLNGDDLDARVRRADELLANFEVESQRVVERMRFLRQAMVDPPKVSEVRIQTGVADVEQSPAAQARDVMKLFRNGFTLSELAVELDTTPAKAKKYLEPFLLGGRVVQDGKLGSKPFYKWSDPEPVPTPAREKRTPPENLPPAKQESRATGLPVRVAAQQKLTRRGRSTPSTGHHARQRDKRYERQQQANAERGGLTEAQRKNEQALKAERDFERLQRMNRERTQPVRPPGA